MFKQVSFQGPILRELSEGIYDKNSVLRDLHYGIYRINLEVGCMNKGSLREVLEARGLRSRVPNYCAMCVPCAWMDVT